MEWEDAKDLLVSIVVLFVGISVMILCLVIPFTFFEKKRCDTLEQLRPDVQSEWTFWTGCVITDPDSTVVFSK